MLLTARIWGATLLETWGPCHPEDHLPLVLQGEKPSLHAQANIILSRPVRHAVQKVPATRMAGVAKTFSSPEVDSCPELVDTAPWSYDSDLYDIPVMEGASEVLSDIDSSIEALPEDSDFFCRQGVEEGKEVRLQELSSYAERLEGVVTAVSRDVLGESVVPTLGSLSEKVSPCTTYCVVPGKLAMQHHSRSKVLPEGSRLA